MYEAFLEVLLAYIKALNAVEGTIQGVEGTVPYITHIPVLMDDTLVGFLRDEVGGAFAYYEATADEQEWWEKRPWRRF